MSARMSISQPPFQSLLTDTGLSLAQQVAHFSEGPIIPDLDPEDIHRSGSPSEVQDLKHDLASTIRATREVDREKGRAVAHQKALWDALLDARIRIQKTVTATNDLPSRTDSANLPAESSVAHLVNQTIDEATSLYRELLVLQKGLHLLDGTFNSSLDTPSSSDAEDNHDSHIKSLSAIASRSEASYHPHLAQTLTKWSNKTQMGSLSIPNNRSSFKQTWTQDGSDLGIVAIIDKALTSDSDKLSARTKALRGGHECLGDFQDDVDTFDDTDFYQQLLRDVIHSRNSQGEGQEWIKRQQAGKSLRHANTDTKASKGRKLRYEVHEKLQHFMVPILVMRGGWHEEQIDDLFLSLPKSPLIS